MAVKILHKRSAVQFKNATGAQLELGELGLNYHESGPYLQCKDAAGEVVQLGGVYVGSGAPGNTLKGAWWLRDTDDTLFLYDGTSWVEIAGGSGGGGGSVNIIGADGIEVATSGTTYTVSVDLASPANGLAFAGGKLRAEIATTSSLGVVSIGSGIDVNTAGEISVDLSGVDVNADLDYVPNGNNAGTVTNTAGDNATIPIATNTVAGLFTGDEKQKLAGIETGVQFQDLGYTPNGDNAGTVTITDGTDATVPIATNTVAGLFTGAEKQKLDGLSNDATNEGKYLRVDTGAPDQTRASGKVTFSDLTTHAEGVSVTGGNSVGVGNGLTLGSDSSLGVVAGSARVIILNQDPRYKISFTPSVNAASGNYGYGILFTPAVINSTFAQEVDLLRIQPNLENLTTETVAYNSAAYLTTTTKPTAVKNVYAYAAEDSMAFGTDRSIGFYSQLLDDGDKKYNFYADGSAPNYFRGPIFAATGATKYPTIYSLNSQSAGINVNCYEASRNGRVGMEFTGFNGAEAGNSQTPTKNRYAQVFTMSNAEGTVKDSVGAIMMAKEGNLQIDLGPGGSATPSSDYRIKENISSLPSAVNIIKQLNPVSFDYTGSRPKNQIGFIAHELQEHVSQAVIGAKDATEAIGTYTDAEGVVITDVTEPEAMPYGETWVQTGTRPIYQGVDVSKLVPLLTKALQEALERIEVLEAAIS